MQAEQQRLSELDYGTVPIEFVTISLDPENDTPQVMRAYADSLGADADQWHFVTGPVDRLKLIVGSGFGVYFDHKEDGRLVYDPAMMLVDGLGILRAEYITGDPGADRILRDMNLILEEIEKSEGLNKTAYEAAHLFMCYPQGYKVHLSVNDIQSGLKEERIEKVQHTESTTESTQQGGWLRYKWLLVGFGALLFGLLVGWAVLAFIDASYTYGGTVIQSPDPVRNFTLTGPDGKPVNLADYRGQAVLLYFGYTFCPDVCPATLAEVAKARRQLGKDAEKLQVVMITVDPLRDTPEKLGEYVTHFDPSFIGLTGNENEIATVATIFGIYYEKQEGSEATGYLVDHTASVIVIDQEGYLRLIYPFGTAGEDIAKDLSHLIQ